MFKLLLALVALVSWCRATVSPPSISRHSIGTPICVPGKSYNIPHPQFCDRYYSCIDGFFHEWQCRDGQAFQPNGECIFSHLVNCTSRPQLQPPQGFGFCPRLYGWFPDPIKGCNYLYECIEGIPTQLVCAEGLMYDANGRYCRDATKEEFDRCFRLFLNAAEPSVTVQVVAEVPAPVGEVEPGGPAVPQPVTLVVEHVAPVETSPSLNVSLLSVDKVPDAVPPAAAETVETTTITTSAASGLVDFSCPKNSIYLFGDHARFPFPGNCRFFVMCWKSGLVTVGGCEEGDAFDPRTFTCRPAKFVAGCTPEV